MVLQGIVGNPRNAKSTWGEWEVRLESQAGPSSLYYDSWSLSQKDLGRLKQRMTIKFPFYKDQFSLSMEN